MATPEDLLVERLPLLPGEEPVEEDPSTPVQTRRMRLVGRMVEDAIRWREENLEPLQERATKYYNGDISDDVPNTPGRSQAVSRDVLETVRMILPPLGEIFSGTVAPIEFEPTEKTDIVMAREITRYITQVVMHKDNPGNKTNRGVHKDALVRKLGITKVFWDESPTPVIEAGLHTGLSPQQIADLEQSAGVEAEVFGPDENGLFNAHILRDVTQDGGRVKRELLPSEEVVWSPDARSPEDAQMIAHVRDIPANEAIEMGFDPALVRRHSGTLQHTDHDGLEAARRVDGNEWDTGQDTRPEETKPVRVAEVYVLLPVADAQDAPESDDPPPVALHKMFALGQAEKWEVVHEEVWDFMPFTFWCPDPEPHTIIGNSVADLVEDIQRIRSQILRGILDSLASHLDPAMEVGPGVNLADVLSQKRGRVIRSERMGNLREIVTEFVGADGLAVFGAMNEMRTARVGVSPESMGLDAEALQSSSPIGVDAIIKAAQAQIKEIARIFADAYAHEAGLIYRLLVKHQDKPRMVRFGSQFVEMSPQDWEADMDVIVNVGVGANTTEEKIAELIVVAQKQEEHLQNGSPLTDLGLLRNTYARIHELQGQNPDEFWVTTEQLQQQMAAQAQQPKEPTPEEMLVQVEMAKIQSDQEIKLLDSQTKIAIEQIKAGQNADKMFLDALAKDAELVLKREQAEVGVIQSAQQGASQ
jgi:hypothetical protein